MQKPIALCIAGARPNFMKIAPLVHAMNALGHFEPVIVHTGQHYDVQLSKVFFDELAIPEPQVNLQVGSGSRLEQIAAIKERFQPVLAAANAEVLIVVGDVNSTIACAEVAREQRIPVAHVEAGLRSFDASMPEELNRIATDAISDYLFVTEQAGIDNLKREEILGKTFLSGNVMIDTLQINLERAASSTLLSQLGLSAGNYLVATFHRPSNVDEKGSLTRIVDALSEIAARVSVVLPLHPRTKQSAERHGLLEQLWQTPGLVLTEPLGYLDFLHLISKSKGVITDSGGIQEETTYLQVPCITMRENTERPSTTTLGTNTLVGSDLTKVLAAFNQIQSGSYKKGTIPPFWDGRAALRIIETLHQELHN